MNRPRFGSRPEVHAPDVYEILADHATAIGELKGLASEGKLADAQILSELRDIKATDRHATTKLISALVVTVITTIGGVIGTVAAMRPGASAEIHTPARSALDVRLDQCRPITPGPSREECFARVMAETEH
jgi:hypothetical protein